jgi:hypothetical protein
MLESMPYLKGWLGLSDGAGGPGPSHSGTGEGNFPIPAQAGCLIQAPPGWEPPPLTPLTPLISSVADNYCPSAHNLNRADYALHPRTIRRPLRTENCLRPQKTDHYFAQYPEMRFEIAAPGLHFASLFFGQCNCATLRPQQNQSITAKNCTVAQFL